MSRSSLNPNSHDPIYALATPRGVGALAVTRVSGPGSLQLMRPLAPFLPEKPEGFRIFRGQLRDPEEGGILDDVLISYFREGFSYTGEESLEISCHGGLTVIEVIARALLGAGFRPAQPGEFTFRAFRSGRIDLVQAEAVLDVIQSRSPRRLSEGIRRLDGELSGWLEQLSIRILGVSAQLEAEIDFSEEGLEVWSPAVIAGELNQVLAEIEQRLRGSAAARREQAGVRVAIVGPPNAGKSSLLNSILGYDRSLVSNEAGTTRDYVDAEVLFEGVALTIVDTAGIRDTQTQLERQGIERSKYWAERSDIILWVIDLSEKNQSVDWGLFEASWKQPVVVVGNKVDLLSRQEAEMWLMQEKQRSSQFDLQRKVMGVSARNGSGVLDLLREIVSLLGKVDSGSTLVSPVSERQIAGLQETSELISEARDVLRDLNAFDLAASNLRAASVIIHRLLGHEFHEQTIDRVFREFCLGK